MSIWLLQVAQVTPKPLKRMLSSRPGSRKGTTEDREEHHLHRNALSSTSAEGAPSPPQKPAHVEVMRRAQTAPFPLVADPGEDGISLGEGGMSLNVSPPQLGGESAARPTGEDKASPIG